MDAWDNPFIVQHVQVRLDELVEAGLQAEVDAIVEEQLACGVLGPEGAQTLKTNPRMRRFVGAVIAYGRKLERSAHVTDQPAMPMSEMLTRFDHIELDVEPIARSPQADRSMTFLPLHLRS